MIVAFLVIFLLGFMGLANPRGGSSWKWGEQEQLPQSRPLKKSLKDKKSPAFFVNMLYSKS